MCAVRRLLLAAALLASLAGLAVLRPGEAVSQQPTMPKSLIDGGEAEKPAPKQKQPKPAEATPAAKPRPPKKVKKPEQEETAAPAPAPTPGPAGSPVSEQGYTLTYSENFTSPDHGWTEKETQEIRLQKKPGAYCMYHKRTDGSWLSYKSIGFRPDDDFILDATFKKISGPLNYGFGLIWGVSKDPSTTYRYLISGDGSYSIQKFSDDKLTIIVDWTPCAFIRKGNGAQNKLKMHRVGNSVQYYINGNYVTTTKYERPSHAKVGFVVFNNQEIEVNHISLKTKVPR
ncbi:hypothetical protein JCM14635_12040 [Megalodesulfovibrio paquesii]